MFDPHRGANRYIDAQGALQLSITNHGTAEVPEWYSTEVILRESLGYGTYLYAYAVVVLQACCHCCRAPHAVRS